ncbi:MAG TPA: hypothetical protein VGQ18_13600 [Gemmatimonadales bacterium]|jgi:hypothetical protein|nr:hypothetical protein [Gemmatimonadales bacterium]
MTKLSQITLLALLCAGATPALAQTPGLPTSQPSLLTIVREEVKVGRTAEHARIEAGWPAAYERAKSPDYYLAMVSMTGPSEAWYISPYASHAAIGESMKREAADAVLSAELARLSHADGEVLNNSRTIQAVARPELSMGAYPDLARQRFWEITTFRVRPGHEAEFDAAAKAYMAAAQRLAPGTTFRVYEVIAGGLTPTYLIFSSIVAYGEFDQMLANGMATMQGANAEERAALQKFSTDALLNGETNRFRLDPKQSYVSRETRATDAAFWGSAPRAATARPATARTATTQP